MTLLGIDVSHYQASGSTSWWATAKRAGITYGFAKAGESLNYRDPTFAANVRGMKANGITPGAYWFIRSGNGSGQADAFIASVLAVNGGATRGMLCVLDAEDGAWTDILAFCARFRTRVSQPLIIYTGAWYWSGRLGNPSGANLGPLWHSRYPNMPPAPPATQWASIGGQARRAGFSPGYGRWPGATFWQFSHNALIGGTTVDANAFEGTAAQLAALTGTTQPKDPGMDMSTHMVSRPNVTVDAQMDASLSNDAYLIQQVAGVTTALAGIVAKVAALATVAAGVAPPVDIDKLAALILAGLPPGAVLDPAMVTAACRKALEGAAVTGTIAPAK